MENLVKVAAAVVVAVMLSTILQRQGKEYVTLLILGVCAMGVCFAFSYIRPVVSFLKRLQDIGNLNDEALKILLKSVGICLLNEICGALCVDSGNNALSKMLNLISTAAIMWISLPIFEQIIDLITEVLEGI